jgi:hypothetical protein
MVRVKPSTDASAKQINLKVLQYQLQLPGYCLSRYIVVYSPETIGLSIHYSLWREDHYFYTMLDSRGVRGGLAKPEAPIRSVLR